MGRCPHANGSLGLGWIEDGEAVCPLGETRWTDVGKQPAESLADQAGDPGKTIFEHALSLFRRGHGN